MVLPEDQLLFRLNPSIQDDSDAWPEFSLTEVTTTSSQDIELASLLDADDISPVNITGILEIPPRANSKYFKAPYSQRQAIQITGVVMYSFSQFEDGSFGFWGAGRAGWYRISPSVSYFAIFAGMEEAVAMFYFLADKYSRMLGKQVKTSRHGNKARALKLFDEFMTSNACRRRSTDDVRIGFQDHRRFLIKSMLEGQEGLDWELTPVFRYYKESFHDEFHALVELVSGNQANSAKFNDETLQSANSYDELLLPGKREAARIERRIPEDDRVRRVSDDSTKGRKVHAVERETPLSEQRLSHIPTRRQYQNDEGLLKGPIITQGNGLPSHLQAHRLPQSYLGPQGHADTWICPFDGCNHRVWDATSTTAISKIEAHLSGDHQNYIAQDLDPSRLMTCSSGNGSINQGWREPRRPKSGPSRTIVRRY